MPQANPNRTERLSSRRTKTNIFTVESDLSPLGKKLMKIASETEQIDEPAFHEVDVEKELEKRRGGYLKNGHSVDSTSQNELENWFGKCHAGDAIDLMNKLAPESIGCVVTSPPYNLKNSTGNGMKEGTKTGKWKNNPLQNGYTDHNDTMPHDDYVEWQKKCLRAMMRVLREDGAIFYNHKTRVQAGLLQDRHDILGEFPVRQCIIWQRNGGFNFNPGYFLPTYEVIYLICKPKFRLAPKANAWGDVWKIPQENNNPHPAPFPVELAQRCIASTTAEIILDPFMGSGQTAIAAEALGRDWIGIDISKDYCKLAKERINAARTLFRKDANGKRSSK